MDRKDQFNPFAPLPDEDALRQEALMLGDEVMLRLLDLLRDTARLTRARKIRGADREAKRRLKALQNIVQAIEFCQADDGRLPATAYNGQLQRTTRRRQDDE